MSAERQWEQMSTLERHLRSHLYQPTDLKKRAEGALAGHIRAKRYREAADCQDMIREAEREIEKWQGLIDLYLVEIGAKAPEVAQ